MTKGSGFFNQLPGLFFPTSDPLIPTSTPGVNYTPYSSPYKQFVYDSSVSGAQILSGVYVSGDNNLLTRNSGVIFDYLNGRILYSGSNVPGFSGNFSNCEYNFYTSAENSENFILEGLMGVNQDLGLNTTGVATFPYAAPCIIVSIDANENLPFSFGGSDTTRSTARLFIISYTRFGQDCVTSIFRDSNLLYFPLITDSSDLPLNIYGDLKGGNYNYANLVAKYNNPIQWTWIKEVHVSNVSEDRNKNRSFFLSYVEFTLENIRFPRQPQIY